jgi:sodium transport system permease protein
VSVLIAVLSCLSFLPGQWVLRSDTLAAMFQYGPREAALFIVILLPLAAALAAVLMAVAIRSRSFKEAQASSTIVVPGGVAAAARQRLRSRRRGAVAPVGARRWRQNYDLMTRVLKGEALGLEQVLIAILRCCFA